MTLDAKITMLFEDLEETSASHISKLYEFVSLEVVDFDTRCENDNVVKFSERRLKIWRKQALARGATWSQAQKTKRLPLTL